MADSKRLRPDGFDMMYSFLLMGGQRSNIPALKEYCADLQQAMLQKTGGQEKYKKTGDVNFDDVPTDFQRDPAKGGMKMGICLLYIALGTMFIMLCGSGYGAWAGAVMIAAGCFLALHIDTRNERKFDALERRISELEGRLQSGEGKVPR